MNDITRNNLDLLCGICNYDQHLQFLTSIIDQINLKKSILQEFKKIFLNGENRKIASIPIQAVQQ